MTILALDSSGLVASVAILKDDQLIAEYSVNYKKTHSQTLLPMLDTVMKMVDMKCDEVDAIAIASGPGSFTGLRIGSATAKGLAQALDKPIVSVPTLEGLATNVAGTDKLICPMMDARRKQVYSAIYQLNQDQLNIVKEQSAIEVEEMIQELNQLNQSVILLGDGVPVYMELIEEQLKVPYEVAPAHMAKQRAGSVAVRAQALAKEGKLEKASEHKPEYLRLSQAERERLEREKKTKE